MSDIKPCISLDVFEPDGELLGRGLYDPEEVDSWVREHLIDGIEGAVESITFQLKDGTSRVFRRFV